MLLASFGAAASQYFFEEQSNGPNNLREATPRWHFLAFFVSGTPSHHTLPTAILTHHPLSGPLLQPRLPHRLRAPDLPASRRPTPRRAPAHEISQPHAQLPRASSAEQAAPRSLRHRRRRGGAVIPRCVGRSVRMHDGMRARIPGRRARAQAAADVPHPDRLRTGLARCTRRRRRLACVEVRSPKFSPSIQPVLTERYMCSRFNHWAHLGGVAFGALYWAYGPRVWEFFREASLGGLPPSLTILPPELYQNRDSESTT